MRVHRFGVDGEWGVSTDDGCLRFHPQMTDSPHKTSAWVWREAWDEVTKLGGFDAVVESLRTGKIGQDVEKQ